jgi:hypothetical protein
VRDGVINGNVGNVEVLQTSGKKGVYIGRIVRGSTVSVAQRELVRLDYYQERQNGKTGV